MPSGSAVLNAHVLIAVVGVVPQVVLAPAVVTFNVLEVTVNAEAKLLNTFSITLPPRTAAPSTSNAGEPVGPTRTPTDVREELTTVEPIVVVERAN